MTMDFAARAKSTPGLLGTWNDLNSRRQMVCTQKQNAVAQKRARKAELANAARSEVLEQVGMSALGGGLNRSMQHKR